MRALLWWLRSVMGDHDYQHYVDHMHRRHPDTPVRTERDYWRWRHADADANPGARCC